MPRSGEKLMPRDLGVVRELSRELQVFDTDAPPVFEGWLPEFQRALGLDLHIFYGVQPVEDGFALSFGFMGSGSTAVPRHVVNGFDAALRQTGRSWGLYSPMKPEPLQRNRVVSIEPFAMLSQRIAERQLHDGVLRRSVSHEAAKKLERSHAFYKSIGLDKGWQLRALICDGDTLLGWLGGYLAEPPTVRQRALLGRLLPAVKKRLQLQEKLSATSLSPVLSTALNEIPGASFLIGPRGNIEFANTHGAAMFDRSPVELRRQLAEAIASPGVHAFRVEAIRVGGAAYHLVIGPRPSALHERLPVAVKTWELTPRQSVVLELVLLGHSDKAIANKLDCSRHTAELHVAAIRAKAGAESRASLAAKFWLTM